MAKTIVKVQELGSEFTYRSVVPEESLLRWLEEPGDVFFRLG